MKDATLYLNQAIKDFDRFLQKDVLGTLSLQETAQILNKIEEFYSFVDATHPQTALIPAMGAEAASPDYELDYLLVVGCRLCSDLNEKILEQMLDVIDEREQTVDHLVLQLRKSLQDRHLTGHLLKKAQHLRNLTLQSGQAMGLGVIL